MASAHEPGALQSAYSFGITVDREREPKGFLSQEKSTLYTVHEDHANSESGPS
jgi:hypothetical protein